MKKQANVIPVNYKNTMWEKGILSPDLLRDTVLFLIGKNVGLHAGDDHHVLWRHSPWQPSQFSFQNNHKGVRCIVYTEDTVTKTHDWGINRMCKSKKINWIYPSSDIS